MKKKPELDDIDVVFEQSPLSKDEKKRISQYIQQDKAKHRKNIGLVKEPKDVYLTTKSKHKTEEELKAMKKNAKKSRKRKLHK